MVDYYVYLVPLPDGFNEAILPCADGFTIYINDKLDQAHRVEALNHAIKHINREDFGKDDVQQIEADVHRKDV